MVLFYTAIPLAIIVDVKLIALMGVAILMYVCNACVQDTTNHIINCQPMSSMFTKMEKSIEQPPILKHTISCYHIENYKDAKGRTRTRRKFTHNSTEQFVLQQWQDQSPPISTLDYISILLVARIKTSE